MSKFRTQISLNKDLFDIFYEYYIDFKNYIIILNLQIIYLRKNLRTYTKQNNGNTINELNDKIQSLTNENNTLKQENKTFLKIIELMQRGTDKEELSVQQQNK